MSRPRKVTGARSGARQTRRAPLGAAPGGSVVGDAPAGPMAARRPSRSELVQRVIFSVLAVPAVLAVIWAGDAALAALLAVVAAVSAWEFYRLAAAGGYPAATAVGIPAAGVIPLLVHATSLRLLQPSTAAVVTGTALLVVLLFAVAVARGPARRPLATPGITLIGIAYTGGMLSFAYALRYHGYAVGRAAGSALLLLPVLLTWTSDTGAFAVGRALGRHKLLPLVSPSKTVEGALGALVLSALVSWLFVRSVLVPVAQLGLPPGWSLGLGVAVSAAVQAGDLTESLFKREAGVKHSSHLLPGHGGVLDRVDGLLFALPVAYALLGALLIPAPR